MLIFALLNPCPAAEPLPGPAAEPLPGPAAEPLPGDEDPTRDPATALLTGEVTGFGAGLILGLPTGISFAWRPAGPVYWDGAVAWSFSRGSFSIHADMLAQLADLSTEEIPDTRFPVYVGAGPRMRIGEVENDGSNEGFDFGVRVPIGMSVIHAGVPLEGFLEAAPGVRFYPETSVLFDIAVGARFYFPS